MPRAVDVAQHILDLEGQREVPAMRLQRLTYYAHCWHLVWDHRPLIADRIEAWTYGPVIPALYQYHRGSYAIADLPPEAGADVTRLTVRQKAVIKSVVDFYCRFTTQELAERARSEAPWIDSRVQVQHGQLSNRLILNGQIEAFYRDQQSRSAKPARAM